MPPEAPRGDRWHVEVDRTLCIGSGMCVGAAPGRFRLDAARQSHPDGPDQQAAEALLAAAENCPVEAITITDRDSGEVLFPPED
jgi:ferredoxin